MEVTYLYTCYKQRFLFIYIYIYKYVYMYIYVYVYVILKEKKEKLWRSHEASMTNNELKSNSWVDRGPSRAVRDWVVCALGVGLGQGAGSVAGNDKCPISIIYNMCVGKRCDHSKSRLPRQMYMPIHIYIYIIYNIYILYIYTCCVCVSECAVDSQHALSSGE